ncbi:hypothetical protein PHLCEN_2v3 [Hermanssonia centrifuga]|uniref:Uncharacterized protein n=1 Tax=Hermanssonia centrifuga TaxID=98765 RepID=A0A2R6S7A9_9APHY|nr:hypothetical protein PHLCEN_2v3 [Hermanssonia centrifuga]
MTTYISAIPHIRQMEEEVDNVHVQYTDPTSIRTNAGNVVLKVAGKVLALAVVEPEVLALANPVVIGARVNVPVNFSSAGL